MDSLLVFVSLAVLSKAVPECESPEWKFYERDKCCVRAIQDELPYDDAKQACRALGGHNLAIIMDASKMDFIAKNVVDWENVDDEYSYWIGLTNEDGDGMYEWANGSRLDINIVSDQTRSSFEHEFGSSDCGTVFESQYDKWACWSSLRSLCEKCLQPPTSSVADESQCAYPDLECNCQESAWIRYEQGQKYLKVVNVLKDYESAFSHCDSFGALLLTPSNNNTVNFVQELSKSWPERFMFYWAGIRRQPGSVWMLPNGSAFEETDYLQWLAVFGTQLQCSGIVWQLYTNLVSTDCSFKNYFICEAEELCAIDVVLQVGDVELNGGQKTETLQEVTVTNDQQLTVACLARKFQSIIEHVEITCTEQNVNKAVGVQEAMADLFMNASMHGVTCTCTMKLKVKDPRPPKIDFKITFYTRPYLVREPDEMKKIVVRQGKTVNVNIDIYANPRPHVSQLTINDSVVDPNTYYTKMAIASSKHMIRYKAFLSVFNINQDKSGFYTVTITNGIDADLEYTFLVQYQEVEATEPESFGYWLVFVGILVFFSLAIVSRFIGRSILVINGEDGDDAEMDGLECCNYGPEEGCDELVGAEKDDVIEADDDPKEDPRSSLSIKGSYHDTRKGPSDPFGSAVDQIVERKVTWVAVD